MQNERHESRRPTGINQTNILAIREIIKGAHHLTILKIATKVRISYVSLQMVWVTEKCQQSRFFVFSWKIRKWDRLARVKDCSHGVENRRMISWDKLSPVKRHRWITTVKRLDRQELTGKNLKKQNCLSTGKVPASSFSGCRSILLVDILHVWCIFSFAFYGQYLDKLDLSTEKTGCAYLKCDSATGQRSATHSWHPRKTG